MARRVVLQCTGMDSTKYGSFERYFVRVAEVCRDRGYATVMQYESTPASSDYVRDLEDIGAHVEIAPSHGSAIAAMTGCSRLIVKYRPAVINNHFAGRMWDATVPVVGRLGASSRLIRSVHSDIGYPRPSRMRHILNHYDKVVAISNAVRAGLERGGVDPSRLETLYLGLIGQHETDEASRQGVRRDYGLPENAVVLGCIAFAGYVKGVDMLLRALRIVLESHPNVYLLQIGVERSAADLLALSAELGVADRVIWAGVVDDGWRLLAAADVYVQPSRSEGQSLATLEAMALSLPVVATNVGGLKEVVIDGETGLIADPDPASIAVKIEDMLCRPDRWSDYGDRGLARLRANFDGNVSVNRLVNDIYQLPAHE